MRTLHVDAEGHANHWTMTRKEFFSDSTDVRNKPGRTEAPTRIANDPKGWGTMIVQVVFVCEHDIPEKTQCAKCENGKA